MAVDQIGGAIRSADFAACFVQEQHPRRMVPCQRAFEDGDVVLAQHDARVLFGGAARNIDQRIVRGDVGAQLFTLHRIGKHQRNRGNRRFCPAGARDDLLIANPRALALFGMAKALAQRIVDPAADDVALFRQCDQNAEGRLARGEVVGAVQRIDDPAQLIAQSVQHGGIGMGCFLANNFGFGQQSGEVFAEDRFRLMIGHGHCIIGSLGDDLVAGQRLVMRQDRAVRGIDHDRLNGAGEGAHDR